MRDLYLLQVKSPAEARTPTDYFKYLRTIPAEAAYRPIAATECALAERRRPADDRRVTLSLAVMARSFRHGPARPGHLKRHAAARDIPGAPAHDEKWERRSSREPYVHAHADKPGHDGPGHVPGLGDTPNHVMITAEGRPVPTQRRDAGRYRCPGRTRRMTTFHTTRRHVLGGATGLAGVCRRPRPTRRARRRRPADAHRARQPQCGRRGRPAAAHAGAMEGYAKANPN